MSDEELYDVWWYDPKGPWRPKEPQHTLPRRAAEQRKGILEACGNVVTIAPSKKKA